MVTVKKVHKFAVKWLEKYADPQTSKHELKNEFADECFALECDINYGKEFELAYADINAFKDYKALKKIIYEITDSELLSAVIFLKWRYIIYWGGENFFQADNKKWFIIALKRLAVISSEELIENIKPDRVIRISIDYQRITKMIQENSGDDPIDYDTGNYSEKLIIDRETETVKYIQQLGTVCVISKEYYIQEAVASFLDGLDADFLFNTIKGNPVDLIENPNESSNYVLTVDYNEKAQLVFKGTFDRDGLPEDWPEFVDELYNLMQYYDFEEILNPFFYQKSKRRANEYIFLSVEFAEWGKSYYYLTDDDSIEQGDYILVSAGKNDKEAIVKVVDIEYFSKENAPFPIYKTKWIIRKCINDDFHTS